MERGLAGNPRQLVATVEIAKDDDVTLQVEVNDMSFQGVVLRLKQPSDAEKLSKVVPLLSKLPWQLGSITLGESKEELGNPSSYPHISDTSATTLRWEDKTLVIQSRTGGPGVGRETTALWEEISNILAPLYDFSPKLEMPTQDGGLVLEKPLPS
mmetsp:Transcript_46737/g.111152  ORF Transcript_46737/g.111152 Transcript_46737/m.111152 type:complete len:155 (-) Transcript_46737:87-551(-)